MTCQSIDEKGGQQYYLSIPFYFAFYSLILQFHKYQSLLTLTIKVTKVQTEEIEPKESSIEKPNPLKCNLNLTQQIKYILYLFPKKVPQVVCVTKGNHQDQRSPERAFSKVPFTTIF